MAGFVPSPQTVRVNFHWSIHGRPQLNVLHGLFSTVGPVNPAAAQNIFNDAVAALTTTNFLPFLASTTTLDAVGVTDLRNAAVPEVLSTGAAVAGTNTSAALPDQISFLVTLRTNQAGRSFRGRIFQLGMAVNNMGTNGEWLPNTPSGVIPFWQAVRTSMSGQGMPMAIRSPARPERPSKPGGTLPAKPFAITEVSNIVSRTLIPATNRRRTDLLRR